MDFNYTDEQTMLADAVARWLESDYDFARRRRIAACQEPWDENWRTMGDLGLLGINVPEEAGGLGGSAVEALIIMQALGRALVVEPFLPTALVAAPLIARAGSEKQQAQLLPAIVSGDLRIVVATQEPGARFDLDHVATTATRRGESYVLDGRKAVVVGADSAQLLVIPARTFGKTTRDTAGISLFIVPAEASGVQMTVTRTIDGLSAADISFAGVEVGSDALLGPLHNGYEELERAVDRGIAGLCAEAVGAMERLMEMTAEHLRTRRQFGQPIGRFQALQHRAADMAIAIEQARATTLAAAASIDLDDRIARRRTISAAKAMAAQSGRQVGEQAVQLHGGMGMTDDLAVGWYFKRLIAIDLTYGDGAHHLERYGATL